MENITLTDEAVYAFKTILESLEREKLPELCKDSTIATMDKYQLIALRMNLVTLLETDNNTFENKVTPAKKVVAQYAQEYTEVTSYLEKKEDTKVSTLVEMGREKAAFQKTFLEAREKALEAFGLKVWGNGTFAVFFHLKKESAEHVFLDVTEEQKEFMKVVFEEVFSKAGFDDELVLQVHNALK